MARTFKAILWDNDGVLVDTEQIYFRTTRKVLSEVGIGLDEKQYRELFLRSSQGAWHLAAESGYSREEVESLRARRNDLYAVEVGRAHVEIDGARDVLASLVESYRMAIVTSSRRVPFRIVHQQTGFLSFFELVLTREDYTRSKPDPEPYLTAVDRLGLDPEDCLVIEDSVRGLTAAVEAGIACWVVPNGLSASGDFSPAEKVLSSIHEVPRLLGEEAGARSPVFKSGYRAARKA
jgi:HAD superfamily hydrolase (TIGR01509 family)